MRSRGHECYLGFPTNFKILGDNETKIDFPYYWDPYESKELFESLDICYEGALECLQVFSDFISIEKYTNIINTFSQFVKEKQIDLIVCDTILQLESFIASSRNGGIPVVGISGVPLSFVGT